MEKRKAVEKKKSVNKNTGIDRNTYSKNSNDKLKDVGGRSEKILKVKSRCSVARKCGGCQWIDVAYEEQLDRKKKETAKLLKPYVKLESIIGMEKPEYYRNKVNAAFTHEKGKPLSGVYKDGVIIPVENCLIENEKAGEILQSIRKLLPSFKIKTFDEGTGYGLLRHVMVRIGNTTGQIMVVLVLASPIMPSKNNFVKALLKLHPDITTIIVNSNNRRAGAMLGDKEQVIYGKGYIEDVLFGKTFKITSKSYYHVNPVQTQQLYKKAMEFAGLTGKEEVLDVYSGIGTMSMLAADAAKNIISVEQNKEAVKEAITNAKRNKISNIESYQNDPVKFIAQLVEQEKHIDTVFMEPPYAGNDEVFLNSLATLKPKKVIYLSCNPETLVKDMDYLTKKGYKAERAVAVDMAPFGGRVEVVCQLVRK